MLVLGRRFKVSGATVWPLVKREFQTKLVPDKAVK